MRCGGHEVFEAVEEAEWVLVRAYGMVAEGEGWGEADQLGQSVGGLADGVSWEACVIWLYCLRDEWVWCNVSDVRVLTVGRRVGSIRRLAGLSMLV